MCIHYHKNDGIFDHCLGVCVFLCVESEVRVQRERLCLFAVCSIHIQTCPIHQFNFKLFVPYFATAILKSPLHSKGLIT
jgi:hypothetical protein